MAQVRMAEMNGRFEVVELRVGSVKDNRVVNGQLLRRVRIAEMAADAAAQISRYDLVAPEHEPGLVLNAAAMDATWKGKRDDSMAPHKAEMDRQRRVVAEANPLKLVAAIYSEALRLHQHPTKAVEKALDITPAAAAKRVSRARDKGFLSRTTQGKAAGPKPARKKRTK